MVHSGQKLIKYSKCTLSRAPIQLPNSSLPPLPHRALDHLSCGNSHTQRDRRKWSEAKPKHMSVYRSGNIAAKLKALLTETTYPADVSLNTMTRSSSIRPPGLRCRSLRWPPAVVRFCLCSIYPLARQGWSNCPW